MHGFITKNPFDLQERRQGDLTILFATGQMEQIEVGVVEAAFKRLTQEGRLRVILDLSEVTTVSTLAVTGLVIWAESFRATGGKMLVAGASGPLRNVFLMIDSAGKLNLQPDVVSAIKSMSPPSVPQRGSHL